jgi:hypothetical protein
LRASRPAFFPSLAVFVTRTHHFSHSSYGAPRSSVSSRCTARLRRLAAA